MAQSNGPGSRVAGGNPLQPAGANGLETPVDPRYPNQPGQPVGAGQHGYNPDGTYAGQDPRTQTADYHYPTAAGHPEAAGHTAPLQPAQPDPRFANPQTDPALQAQQSPYTPQFTPYTAQAPDPYQNQPHQQPAPEPNFNEAPATGAPYNQQGYQPAHEAGHPAPAPHTMDNPAFPQHSAAAGQFQGQPDPTFGAQNQAAPLDQAPHDEWPVTAPPAQNHPDYLAHPDYAQANQQFAQDPNTGLAADPYAQHQTAGGAHEPGAHDHGYEDEDYDDLDDAPAGGGINRTMLIAGVLVGAIAVGGGLAYGWKMISGPAANQSGTTPVVERADSPRKTRPADPGGRQFEHPDAKVLGRLGNAGATRGTSDGGSRKVPTVTVTRDGRVAAQPGGGAAVPTMPNGDPVVSVPGLTVVDAFGAGQPQPSTAPAKNGQPIVVTPPVKKTTTRPRVQIRNAPTTNPAATAPRPPAAPARTATRTPPAQPAQPRAPAPPKKKAAPAAPATPKASSGANGYVAVLASVPVSSSSRMNALMRYADLQQKYGTLLANKTPDVREANLGERGKYHRLLVGPPGSRAQASSLCAKLKAAGYSGCWVTAF